MNDETWLMLSRTRRITKTVRIDEQLLEKIPKVKGAISDMINLGLKMAIESGQYEDYLNQRTVDETG